MPLPLIAAGVAAVGAIGSAAISSSASKNASKVAANSTTQQINATNANRDYQYNLNAPTITHGGAADDRISALLNLGGELAVRLEAEGGMASARGDLDLFRPDARLPFIIVQFAGSDQRVPRRVLRHR